MKSLAAAISVALLTVASCACAASDADTGTNDSGQSSGPNSGETSGKTSGKTLAKVEVLGDRDQAQEIAGSAFVLDAIDLESARVLSVNEALRKIPGVVVRDEEGFGLRPNIGIRGLNPTRSTKVLLLEDGLPAAYAPYGDNASYYHAPIDRYQQVEVLKGVGMLRFGPQTIGGVLNYLTPDAPDAFEGHALVAGGSRGYRNMHLSSGAGGFLLDVYRKEGDGARDNQNLQQTDFNLKAQFEPGEGHALTLRANHLSEDSQVTYSGLTDAEFAGLGARYNPFKNDVFDIRRYGGSLTHRWQLDTGLSLSTSAYGFVFERDWWRQSSSTTDTQCGTAFRDARLAGRVVNVDQCASAQGRLRAYDTFGVEPRLSWSPTWLGGGKLEFGVRAHREVQDRRQVNAASATGRTGTVAEDNERKVRAHAAFVEARWQLGAWQLTPAMRFESIEFKRLNRLNARGNDVREAAFIPGLAALYRLADDQYLYAGIHRGFAPPRVEDLIDNNGVAVDVDAERSRNIELGWRGRKGALSFDLTAFDSDFSNQLAVGSIAGGATPLAQGETRYRGLETGLRLDFAGNGWGQPYLQSALTWLPTADQASPFRAVSNNQPVNGSRAGLRLPYAPTWTGSVRAGVIQGGLDYSVEAVTVDSQYADFLNTDRASTNGNGQIGRLAGYTLINATLNWQPEGLPFTTFVTVKNAADRQYIADRTRGILPGMDRQWVLGVRYGF